MSHVAERAIGSEEADRASSLVQVTTQTHTSSVNPELIEPSSSRRGSPLASLAGPVGSLTGRRPVTVEERHLSAYLYSSAQGVPATVSATVVNQLRNEALGPHRVETPSTSRRATWNPAYPGNGSRPRTAIDRSRSMIEPSLAPERLPHGGRAPPLSLYAPEMRRAMGIRAPPMQGEMATELEPGEVRQPSVVNDLAQTEVSLMVDGHAWVRVTLLSKFAIEPTKKDEMSPEILLFSPHYCYIRPGSGQGIKTDIALELPMGVYGRVISHPEAPLNAQAKLEGMVIEPGSRSNVQLFVFNVGPLPCVIKKGDLLGAVIVLQSFIPRLDIRQRDGTRCAVL